MAGVRSIKRVMWVRAVRHVMKPAIISNKTSPLRKNGACGFVWKHNSRRHPRRKNQRMVPKVKGFIRKCLLRNYIIPRNTLQTLKCMFPFQGDSEVRNSYHLIILRLNKMAHISYPAPRHLAFLFVPPCCLQNLTFCAQRCSSEALLRQDIDLSIFLLLTSASFERRHPPTRSGTLQAK